MKLENMHMGSRYSSPIRIDAPHFQSAAAGFSTSHG
jgi:hypothetical protein